MEDGGGLDEAGGKERAVKGVDLGYLLEDLLVGWLWRAKEIK